MFNGHFPWKTLGVDVRSRSTTLRINCPTSHQIRTQADRLLGPELADVDGNSSVETTTGRSSISTMHLAKGLEFRTVVVMACDDEVVPSQARIETLGDEDDADFEEVYNTESHLLYVACTRARDPLLVTGVNPASEFLDHLRK